MDDVQEEDDDEDFEDEDEEYTPDAGFDEEELEVQ